jgi:hypothetical protein
MKKLLLTTAIVIAAAVSNVQAGPSWGLNLGNGSGFYWGNTQPQPIHYYQPQPVRVRHVGQCNTRYYYSPTQLKQVHWKASNGAACYSTANGQVWYQNPF